MAWRSSGSSNVNLIENLHKHGIIKSAQIVEVMKQVDRANFCKTHAYSDTPQSIGFAVTISAPHLHGRALELLSEHLYEGARALDVGSGSGYLTACMALLVGEKGNVVGIDHIDDLVKNSVDNVKKAAVTAGLLEKGQLKFVVGDGRQGCSEEGPYDAIHVGAAAPVLPEALIEQLTEARRSPHHPCGRHRGGPEADADRQGHRRHRHTQKPLACHLRPSHQQGRTVAKLSLVLSLPLWCGGLPSAFCMVLD